MADESGELAQALRRTACDLEEIATRVRHLQNQLGMALAQLSGAQGDAHGWADHDPRRPARDHVLEFFRQRPNEWTPVELVVTSLPEIQPGTVRTALCRLANANMIEPLARGVYVYRGPRLDAGGDEQRVSP